MFWWTQMCSKKSERILCVYECVWERGLSYLIRFCFKIYLNKENQKSILKKVNKYFYVGEDYLLKVLKLQGQFVKS